MNPWLPRARTGQSSNEAIDGRGLNGRYVQIDWLGFSVSVEIASVGSHNRLIKTIMQERSK